MNTQGAKRKNKALRRGEWEGRMLEAKGNSMQLEKRETVKQLPVTPWEDSTYFQFLWKRKKK
jgi:hypothetical protein